MGREMAKIAKVLRMSNKGDYSIVYVQLEDGLEEYEVYVGGQVETFFSNGKLKAHVRKGRPHKSLDKLNLNE